MRILSQRNRALLEFGGDEIDSIIAFVQAQQTIYQEWVEDSVEIEGRQRRESGNGRRIPKHYASCKVRRAYSWGYVRTLEVRPEGSGEVLTIGGRNAIIEALQLERIVFSTQLSRRQLKQRLCGTDRENLGAALVKAELARDHDRVINTLYDITLALEMGNRLSDLRFIANRLNYFPNLLGARPTRGAKAQVLRIMEVLLNLAVSGNDSMLQMYLCEALWYWARMPLFEGELRRKGKRVLSYCRDSSDPNVRLAALVASARLAETRRSIGEDLLHIFHEAFAGESHFLSWVKETCSVIARDCRRDLPHHVADIISDLVRCVEAGETTPLSSDLETIKTAPTSAAKGAALENLAYKLCFLSRLFKGIERQSSPDFGLHDTSIDLVAYLKERHYPLDEDFPVVFEAKAGRADASAARQLISYCDHRQKNLGQKFGVLIASGDVTREAQKLLETQGARERARYVWLDGAKLKGMASDPREFRKFLTKALRG